MVQILKDIWNIFLVSAEGSFIQVTGFVGAVLLLFGSIDFLGQGKFVESIEGSKKLQPLIGALLGIIPGCGGSIFLMPLYMKGSVSFGAIIATLIATAGDSAFVTMTQAPKDFILLTVLCFIVGVVTGYIVDFFKIGDWVQKRSSRKSFNNIDEKHIKAEKEMDALFSDTDEYCRSCNIKHIGHEEGDEIDLLLHHRKPLNPHSVGYKLAHNYYIVFWFIITIGFAFGIVELTQIDLNNIPNLPNAGKIMGIVGTVVVVLYMIFSKKIIKAQSHEDEEHKLSSFKETLAHNAQETAFVGTWVFAAYFVYEFSVYLMGGEQVIAGFMVSAGLTSVLIGVLVGIIPGCGPQVIFVSLYIKGMFPFAALLANGISQDGDALFPLIAMDRKAAFWATILNTIPAAIVGVIAYYIEMAIIG